MADDAVFADVVAQVARLQALLMGLQAHLLALSAYVSEQPTYDRARHEALYRQARERLQMDPAEDLESALLALLRRFEGPIQ